ncbi:MAG: succinylglutamate desuccinylase/aspartoacylase family protein [Candidatus Velthaea sp.]
MPPPYAELVAAWKSLRATHGVVMREVACVGAPRTVLVAEFGSDRAPAITISAGMHGDEPAAPWALLALVRDRLLDDRFSYRLWPCVNPSGYVAGTRTNAEGADVNRSFTRGGATPEARAIVTANRDRKFRLSLDLHEDFEADGFYLFEPLIGGGTAYFAPSLIAAMDDAGFPVQDLADEGFDLGTPPAARVAQTIARGMVLVDAKAERRFFPDGLPISLFLLRVAAERVLTFESPLRRSWDERIAMHRVAVVHALTRAG